jgi:CO/xanthine dehydrogenase FAD-binding subunit
VGEFLRGEELTARASDELLETIVLPPRTGWRWAFEKFRRRQIDAAMASIAAVVRIGEDGAVAEARFVVGAVGETPLRVQAVEAALTGEELDDATIDRVATLAGDEIRAHFRASLPCSSLYAQELVRTLTRRALMRVSTSTGDS